MLPSSNQPRANGRDAGPATACFKRSRYLRRLLRFRQMDFEFATWQMLYLFTAPQKVYRNFHYRKQTKDQWARDDPAFLVLLSVWLCVSTLGFGFVLSMSFLNTLKLLLWVVFIDCIGVGLLISTLMWSHHSGLVHRIFRGKHTVARRHRLLHLHHLPWLQRAAIPEEHGAAAVPHGATSASPFCNNGGTALKNPSGCFVSRDAKPKSSNGDKNVGKLRNKSGANVNGADLDGTLTTLT
ncbi:unnamed protein product [Lampetra planeri]